VADVGVKEFWKEKSVAITGHTGFKGSWLALRLYGLGAHVHGYALDPPTNPNLYTQAGVGELIDDVRGDLRDVSALRRFMVSARPQIVVHMAAQPIVRRSHRDPVETFEVNVMGTVHLLEAVRTVSSVRVVLVVTTDKVYADRADSGAHTEDDPLGGDDPYSASKACAEHVTRAYRHAYFEKSGVRVATVRAGNVIGGGDYAEDRLIPDVVRSLERGTKVRLRRPHAVRPWQHVLDPIEAYIALIERLWGSPDYCGAWNVGPRPEGLLTVSEMVESFQRMWGRSPEWLYAGEEEVEEREDLRLDAGRLAQRLGILPRLDVISACGWTAEWYRRVMTGESARTLCLEQIARYEELA
jgi:CDP-glucose 4,6-dehydratase